MKAYRFVFSVLYFSLCAGCSVFTSQTISQLAVEEEAPQGVAYSLPKGMVDLTLTVDKQNAVFSIVVEGPHFIPDPRHSYVLNYQPLPNYKDVVSFKTNRNGFLIAARTNVTDQTGGIVVNVAKALSFFGAFEAAPIGMGTEQITKITFDPLDDDDCKPLSPVVGAPLVRRCRAIEQQVNAAMAEYVKKMLAGCAYYVDKSGQKSIASDVLVYYQKQKKLNAEPNSDSTHNIVTINGVVSKDDSEIIINLGNEIATLEAKIAIIDQDTKKVLGDITSAPRPNIPDIKSFLNFDCKTADTNRKKLCDLNQAKKEAEAYRTNLQGQLDDLIAGTKAVNSEKKQQKYTCDQYTSLDKTSSPTARIQIEAFGGIEPSSLKQQASAPADCASGLCYRPKEPYKIVYSVGDKSTFGGSDTVIVELPNKSPLVAVDISRAFFVNKVHNLAFDDDGFLTAVEINKPSELLAVSKLPLEVIGAVAEGLKARVELTNTQRDLAKREASLLQARGQLRDTRTQLESASLVRSQTSFEAAPGQGVTPRFGASTFTPPRRNTDDEAR